MTNLPYDCAFICYQLTLQAEKNERMEEDRKYNEYKRIRIAVLIKGNTAKFVRVR